MPASQVKIPKKTNPRVTVKSKLSSKKTSRTKTRTPTTLFEGRFLRLKKLGTWEYAERTNASGIVATVALTAKDELILVEQYRIPVDRNVIELPAGLAGDIPGEEHEHLAQAAARELVEETGYQAGKMQFLMAGPSSAGLCTEIISFFRAHDLKKVAKGGGADAGESITVHKVPLAKLPAWLARKEKAGCLVDYKIPAALYFLAVS